MTVQLATELGRAADRLAEVLRAAAPLIARAELDTEQEWLVEQFLRKAEDSLSCAGEAVRSLEAGSLQERRLRRAS